MWPVTDRFLDAMRDGTHTVVERITAIDPTGQQVGDPLPVTDWSVTESAAALIRHSCNLSVVGLSVSEVKALIRSSGGTRILMEQGIRYDDGDEEYVPLITAHVRAGDPQRGAVPIEGLDRLALSQRKSTRPVVIPGGTPGPEAIYEMLLAVDPGLTASLMSSEWTVPQLVYPWQTDLLEEAAEEAEALGATLNADRLDQLVVAPRPLLTNPPVWRFAQDSPTHVSHSMRLSHDRVPNVVIVTGQHSSMSEPVHGMARDEDPTSDTWWGRYQEVLPITTEKATTELQCTEMARGILQQVLGGTETLSIRVSPAPVHVQTGDVVDAVYPDLEVDQRMIVASITTDRTGSDIELHKGVLTDVVS